MKTTAPLKVSLLVAVALAAGCTTTTPTSESTAKAVQSSEVAGQKADYEKALAQAKAAVDKAASVGGEWRDIRWKKSKKKYLPSAIDAAAAGDYAKAMKLLDIVQFQAEAGYAQAMAQKNAGPRF